jgi:branched-subunit amino acid transport protein
MEHLWLVVLGMAIVTYIPRMVPLVILRDVQLPKRLKRFLHFVPFTVLSSLIFPDVLTSVDDLTAAICGATTAVILSILKVNLIFVVLGSILVTYLFLFF